MSHPNFAPAANQVAGTNFTPGKPDQTLMNPSDIKEHLPVLGSRPGGQEELRELLFGRPRRTWSSKRAAHYLLTAEPTGAIAPAAEPDWEAAAREIAERYPTVLAKLGAGKKHGD